MIIDVIWFHQFIGYKKSEQPKKQAEVLKKRICNVEKFSEIYNLCNRFLTSKAGCIMIALAEDAAKRKEE
jgi:hypothetical protein